jgi:hypothetical protein
MPHTNARVTPKPLDLLYRAHARHAAMRRVMQPAIGLLRDE